MQDISWKQTLFLMLVGAVFGAVFMHTISGHHSMAATDDHHYDEIEIETHQ